jgi:hypothetical protein
VRDAGVLVDHVGGAVRVLRVHLGGDEHRRVAERPRVVDRGDLADDALVDEVGDPAQDLVLGEPGELRDPRIGARLEWEGALHQVHDPAVGVVQRDRRAVLAAAELGGGAY